jgi:hypothetical protein
MGLLGGWVQTKSIMLDGKLQLKVRSDWRLFVSLWPSPRFKEVHQSFHVERGVVTTPGLVINLEISEG